MDLQTFFALHPKVAVAFSGGTDSAFVLYAARKYGRKVQAYYVKSEFQPEFEWEDALRMAGELGVEMKMLPLKVLDIPCVRENPPDRCYHCKTAVFREIRKAAEADGWRILLDGTNASDDAGDRPGMRALKELEVLSPLRECGLTKKQVRQLSREAGLFTWDKPAYACLATRISPGEEITEQKLHGVEQAETYLRSLGFTDFRVRVRDGHARLQVPEAQMSLVFAHRQDILCRLKNAYRTVSLDLEPRGG